MACSASAPKLAATCGRPTITIRESIPAISTPTVVTVRTVHLYWIRLASVGEWRGGPPPAPRVWARRSGRNTLRVLLPPGGGGRGRGQGPLPLWNGGGGGIRSRRTRRGPPSLPVAPALL